MKEGWERHIEVIKVTKSELEEMIRLYDPAIKVKGFERLSGGLIHTNFKVFQAADARPLVARITKDKANLQKEYHLHKLLDQNESVPKFYMIGEMERFSFGILEWKDGMLLKDKLTDYTSSESGLAGYSLGCQLSRLSEIQFKTSGELDSELHVTGSFKLTPDGFLNTMKYFLLDSKVPRWLNKGLPEKLLDLCLRHSELFQLDKSGPRLVHGDFNGLNILMEGTNVSAILDWEFGLAGSMYMDIGNLLRYENIPHFHEFEHGLYHGLSESGERLPEEWKQIAKLADLVSLCSMLDNDIGGTNRVRDINHLIQRTVHSDLFK